MRESIVAAKALIDAVREKRLEAGTLKWRDMVFSRTTLDGRHRNWNFKTKVNESVWTESVEGFPDSFDTLIYEVNFGPRVMVWAPLGPDAEAPNQIRGQLAGRRDAADEEALLCRQFLTRSAVADRLDTGFVHVDAIDDPYDVVVARPSQLGPFRPREQVYGYYWTVLLGERQIEILGGRERVRREAPCAVIDEPGGASGAAMICSITDRPSEVTADAFIAWREFLGPVLRPGFPQELETCPRYVPGREGPLTRPVWLFEGPPTPQISPTLLTGQSVPGVDPLPIIGSEEPSDPDHPTVLIEVGDAFDLEVELELIGAVVNAWRIVGQGGFGDSEGILHFVSDVTWEASDGVAAFQFDPGTTDVETPLQRLSVALAELDLVLQGRGAGIHLASLVVT